MFIMHIVPLTFLNFQDCFGDYVDELSFVQRNKSFPIMNEIWVSNMKIHSFCFSFRNLIAVTFLEYIRRNQYFAERIVTCGNTINY